MFEIHRSNVVSSWRYMLSRLLDSMSSWYHPAQVHTLEGSRMLKLLSNITSDHWHTTVHEMHGSNIHIRKNLL